MRCTTCAGMLALIAASLGFLSKLVAEAVEEMSMKPVEAVRATGSPFLSVIVMSVLPQVTSLAEPAARFAALRKAAQADESGAELTRAIAALPKLSQAAE